MRSKCTTLYKKLFPNSEFSIKISELDRQISLLKLEDDKKEDRIKGFLINEEIYTKKIKELELSSEKLEHIDDYLLRKNFKNHCNKWNVGFLVFFYEHWDSLESVYEKISKSDLFEATIFVGPRKQFVEEWRFLDKSLKFFKEKGIKIVPLYDETADTWQDLLSFNLDILFVNTPWEGAFPEQYHIDYLSKVFRICYVPYGIMAARFQQHQFNLPFHHKCWKIFAESPFHKNLFAKYSEIGDSNVLVTGYPKLDLYQKYNKHNFDNLWKLKRKNSSVHRIIWAPHWTEGNVTDFAHASFLRLYRYFYELAKSNKNEIDLLIKPHPGLWDNLITKKLLTKEEVLNIKKNFEDLPNVQIYEEPGYFPYFTSSDCLILDSISFISEYLPTKKPIFFITKDKIHEFNEYGEIIMSSLYKGWEETEIDLFIKKVVVKGLDDMYNKRMKVLDKYIYMPPGGAAGQILEVLKDELLNKQDENI